MDEEELEIHMADSKNRVEKLKLPIFSVEADLAQKDEKRMMAEITEAWLLALRKNLEDVERDTEETFEGGRELVRLLVERILVGCSEERRTTAEITYRFGPPSGSSVDGARDSEKLTQARLNLAHLP